MELELGLLPAILSIVVIDLVLSGDNAVVIGMAAQRLPDHQRKVAIVFGGVSAVALRVTLTGIASFLLLVPGLKIVGGILLAWIAFRLLEPGEAQHAGAGPAGSPRGAIWTILVADFIMSLDNVLAVAATAHGDVGLLIFGLLLSMPLVMFAGGLIAGLIDRFWWLIYLGSALIARTGAEMIVGDDLVRSRLEGLDLVHWIFPTAVMLLVVGLAQWVHRRPSRVKQAEPAEPTL